MQGALQHYDAQAPLSQAVQRAGLLLGLCKLREADKEAVEYFRILSALPNGRFRLPATYLRLLGLLNWGDVDGVGASPSLQALLAAPLDATSDDEWTLRIRYITAYLYILKGNFSSALPYLKHPPTDEVCCPFLISSSISPRFGVYASHI